MYSVGTVVHNTDMAVGIVLVQCGAIVYSTLCVKMTQSFSYKTGHYFTAYNVSSVYQARKALSVVYTPSTALHEAHYVWCRVMGKTLWVGYPIWVLGTTASKPIQKNLSSGATASTIPVLIQLQPEPLYLY